MKFLLKFSIIATLMFFALSCAKVEPENYDQTEQQSLQSWITRNAPEATLLDNINIYHQVLETAPTSNQKPQRGEWVSLIYNITDLSGNIIYNRKEKVARIVGGFSPHAHYDQPDLMFIPLDERKDLVVYAIHQAVLKMAVGDVWRLYAPSNVVFGPAGMKNVTGYGGQFALNGNVPVMIDSLQIIQILSDPQDQEELLVQRKAALPEPEGFNMARSDSVKDHIYIQLLKKREKKDTVAIGESVEFYYKAKFLDGFLVSTNIDSVYTNAFGVLRADDNIKSVVVRRTQNNTILSTMPAKTFSAIMPFICYGDSARMVFTSKYAYHLEGRPGNSRTANSSYPFNPHPYSGYDKNYLSDFYNNSYYYTRLNTSSNTAAVPIAEVNPFTPLVIEFVVLPREVEEEEDK